MVVSPHPSSKSPDFWAESPEAYAGLRQSPQALSAEIVLFERELDKQFLNTFSIQLRIGT